MTTKWEDVFYANLDSSAEDWKSEKADNFLVADCESEIEWLMLSELVFCPFGFFIGPHEIYTICGPGYDPDRDIPNILNRSNVVIFPQYKIGMYRADFAVFIKDWNGNLVSLAVECDGHDFHEKTKEQAQRDKKRDRDFQAAGFRVFRFTGSEIFKDVKACVNELDLFVYGLINKKIVAA